mmetsp:Transcript_15999/g.44276  ORF Transcript_15999/g.44276 Transcript_15999/m.44276 type:complete len:128 (+) Transcript_15999:1162-1545(+)
MMESGKVRVDLNRRNRSGETPFHLACSSWDASVASYLAELDPSIDITIHRACRMGSVAWIGGPLAMRQINHALSIDNNDGDSTFQMACRCNRATLLKYYISWSWNESTWTSARKMEKATHHSTSQAP